MKLNLGSGISGPAALNVITLDQAEWKFIEICESYPAHEHYDITTGIRESDNSIEEIWMGDFFEHLLRLKAEFVMKECYRVMKSNGRIRMSVPDMEKVIPRWLTYATTDNHEYNDTQIRELYYCIWGGQDESNQKNSIPDSHFSGYTEKTLMKLITSVGFSKANRISIHGTWYELAMDIYK